MKKPIIEKPIISPLKCMCGWVFTPSECLIKSSRETGRHHYFKCAECGKDMVFDTPPEERPGQGVNVDVTIHVFAESRFGIMSIADNSGFYVYLGMLVCGDGRWTGNPLYLLGNNEFRTFDEFCSFVEKKKIELDFMKDKAKEIFDKQQQNLDNTEMKG